MFKRFITLIVSLLVALTMGVIMATVAWAGSFYVVNFDNRYHWAYCTDGNGIAYAQGIAIGTESPARCSAIGVYNRERVLYMSESTGHQYWTGCGQDLPYYSPRPPDSFGRGLGFWGTIGNSVQVQKHVYYPTAPANVC